jgi:polysaccharide biosynthesis/export protein ExoF
MNTKTPNAAFAAAAFPMKARTALCLAFLVRPVNTGSA